MMLRGYYFWFCTQGLFLVELRDIQELSESSGNYMGYRGSNSSQSQARQMLFTCCIISLIQQQRIFSELDLLCVRAEDMHILC